MLKFRAIRYIGLTTKGKLHIAVLCCLAIAVAVAAAFAFKRTLLKGPHLMPEDTACDFGVVAPGAELQHTFHFKNSGKRPLVIERLITSCGCTRVVTSKDVLSRGEAAQLNVTFVAPNHRGPSLQTVTVHTNETPTPLHVFHVSADVVPRLEYQPKSFDFGIVKRSDLPRTISASAFPAKKEALTAETDNDYLNVALNNMPNGKDKEMKVTLEKSAPNGPISARVLISLHGDPPLTFLASAIGQVIGDSYASPATVFFGMLHEEGTRTNTVQLRTRKKSIAVCGVRLSESLERLAAIDVTSDTSGPLLRVTLSAPRLPKGQRSGKRIDGFIRVVVSADPRQNDTNSLTDGNGDLTTSHDDTCTAVHETINIPVLAFIMADDQEVAKSQ